MKALVVYLSQTGNTRRIAEAIYDALSCKKELKTFTEVKNLEDYDIVFAGFPVWQFGPAEPARKFITENAAGKNIAMFVTHAMDPDAADKNSRELLAGILEKCKSSAEKCSLAGFFSCQGELSAAVADFLLKNSDPELRKFGEMRNMTIGHPDSSEIDSARKFAGDVINRFMQNN